MRLHGQVWDSETLECLRTLEGHEDNVRVLAVGERYVFSGSWDKSIRCAVQPPGAHHTRQLYLWSCFNVLVVCSTASRDV